VNALAPHPDGLASTKRPDDRLDGARKMLASTVLSFAESSDSSADSPVNPEAIDIGAAIKLQSETRIASNGADHPRSLIASAMNIGAKHNKRSP
jgi:hypothetical protein